MNPVYHRENSGSGFFVSQLSDGTEIIWRLLTIDEWLEYDNLFKNQIYPIAYLENEIFSKCVQDKTLNPNELLAGTVKAVSEAILLYSGPQTIDELNHHLDINRAISNEIMHVLVSFVCQGFPAYKPEDVYGLNYPTLMLRVAQAENKMLRTGSISEPLVIQSPEELQQPQTPNPRPLKQTPKIDSKQLFETYKKQQDKPSATKQTIISTQDVQEHNLVYTGHEKEDKEILQHQMEKDTALIYQDYLQQGKDGKITIKTPEERKAEYLAKIKIVKEKQEKLAKVRQEKLEKVQQQAQEAKTKKAKRDPGKRRK